MTTINRFFALILTLLVLNDGMNALHPLSAKDLTSENPAKTKDAEPLVIQAFYSEEDPNWQSISDLLNKIAKSNTRIQLETISIDTIEGYKKLTAAEERLKIQHPGELTVIMGNHVLINRDKQKDINSFLESSITRILNPASIKGKRAAEHLSFAKDHFGKDLTITAVPLENKSFKLFRVNRKNEELGWIAEAFHPISCPVCNDVQFLIAVTSKEKQLLGIQPIRALEKWGKHLPEKDTQKFLSQFKGFNAQKLKKGETEIDTISGATKTSLAYKKSTLELISLLIERSQETSEEKP